MIELSVSNFILVGIGESASLLATHMAGPLRVLGKPNPRVRIPVTIKARAVEIGDVVYLTTVWVEDTKEGTMGVTEKVCIVMGFERPEGYESNASDYLDLMIIDNPAGAIAPAALATAYDGGTTTLTFADVTLFHRAEDDTDLDHFDSGDTVEGFDYDNAAPTTWTATINAIDPVAKTMRLSGITGTPVAPCIVRFREYSQSVAAQTSDGWIWVSDADDGLIENVTVGRRWG